VQQDGSQAAAVSATGGASSCCGSGHWYVVSGAGVNNMPHIVAAQLCGDLHSAGQRPSSSSANVPLGAAVTRTVPQAAV
jgi:hypothetical protein